MDKAIGNQDYTNSEAEAAGAVSRFEKSKMALCTGIVGIEVTPINEAIRYGLYGAAVVGGAGSVGSAAVLGGSTLVIEGSAAMAASEVFDSKASKKAIGYINKGFKKIGIDPETVHTNKAIEGGVALLGGTAISLGLKMIEEPTRTKEMNRKRGVITAAALSGVLGVQGYFMSKGIEVPEPENIGAGVVALGSTFGVAKWVKSKLSKQATASKSTDVVPIEET